MKRLIAVLLAVALIGVGTAVAATSSVTTTTNAGNHQYQPPVVCPKLKDIDTLKELIWYIYLIKTGKCPIPTYPWNCKDKHGYPCHCGDKGAKKWHY